MKNFKVFQGTRSVDAPRLCDSCSNGVVLRGPADSEEYVFQAPKNRLHER
jgi:hypothetical protein